MPKTSRCQQGKCRHCRELRTLTDTLQQLIGEIQLLRSEKEYIHSRSRKKQKKPLVVPPMDGIGAFDQCDTDGSATEPLPTLEELLAQRTRIRL